MKQSHLWLITAGWQFVATFLTLLAVNPMGVSRGDVFSEPKLIVSLVATVVNYATFFLVLKPTAPQGYRLFLTENLHWGAFILCAISSTIFAGHPSNSLIGSEITRNGLFFWIVVAHYSISNGLILASRPQLIRVQAMALVWAGLLAAFVTIYQVINPYFDFSFHQYPIGTQTLLNGMSIGNQPIGFVDHQGINSCFLAVTLVGTVTFAHHKLVPWGWVVAPAIASALIATERRAAILAVTISLLFMFKDFIRKHYKITIAFVLITASILVQFSLERNVSNASDVFYSKQEMLFRNLTAERSVIWKFYLEKILDKPIIGHGFNYRNSAWANQGYNTIINRLYETGLLGLIVYIYLCIYIYRTIDIKYRSMFVCYLLWNAFWYDTAALTGLLSLITSFCKKSYVISDTCLPE